MNPFRKFLLKKKIEHYSTELATNPELVDEVFSPKKVLTYRQQWERDNKWKIMNVGMTLSLFLGMFFSVFGQLFAMALGFFFNDPMSFNFINYTIAVLTFFILQLSNWGLRYLRDAGYIK